MTRPTDEERRQALASLSDIDAVIDKAVTVSRACNGGVLLGDVFHAECRARAAIKELRSQLDANFEWDTDMRGAA